MKILRAIVWKWIPAKGKKAYKFYKLKREFGAFAYRMDTIRGQDADVFIVSFPKSGRTWIRFILSSYIEKLTKQSVCVQKIYESTKNIEKLPTLFFTHDGSSYSPVNLRSSKMLSDKSFYLTNKKTILLVRDPRDIVCSYFHHAKARKGVYHSTINNFIRDDKWGINKIIKFLNGWSPYIENPNLLMCKYEDIKADDISALTNIIQFAGFPLDKTILEQVVISARFNNLKQLAKKKSNDITILRPTNNDPNSEKVRKGKVGGYKEELPDTDVIYVDKAIKNLYPIYDYH